MTEPDDEGTRAEDEFSNLNRLTDILEGLDDRGLVLSVSAFAEEALGDLIRAFLMPVKATSDLLSGFNAPLGTFSSRAKMAHALGLVTNEQFADLERIRRIRNEFAHTWEPLELNDDRVKDLVLALNFNAMVEKFPDTAAEKFSTSASAVLIEIRALTGQIKMRGQSVRLLGQRLVAGVSTHVEDKLAFCRERLDTVNAELELATGEKRRFLVAHQDRWLSMLYILGIRQSQKSEL